MGRALGGGGTLGLSLWRVSKGGWLGGVWTVGPRAEKARLWCPAVPSMQVAWLGLGGLSCRSGSTHRTQ